MIEKILERLEEKAVVNPIGGKIVKYVCISDIIDVVQEVAKEYGNGWITDRNPTKEECKNNRFWITDSDRWTYEADYDLEYERWRDLETGGFISVIAWHMLPLPAPYQKGE